MSEMSEFEQAQEDLREEVVQDESEAEYEIEVIEPSRPARPEDASTSIQSILAQLALCGWWSASQITRTLLKGAEYKTGARAGESRPDKEPTNFFIRAAHPDQRTVSAWYIDGKLKTATIGKRTESPRVIERVGELEAYVRGESC